MNDFNGLLASDYGFKPKGKSAAMAGSRGSSNSTAGGSLNFDHGSRPSSRSTVNSNSFTGSFMDDGDTILGSSKNQKNQDFGDIFGGSSKSETRGADEPFNFDSMFHDSGDSGAKSMNSPVYDKPVYDDDIFEGVPGLKSSSKAKYEDVFSSVSSAPDEGGSAFDDLLGGFGKAEREWKSYGGKRSERYDKDTGVSGFDDLVTGFGSRSPASNRSHSEAGVSKEPTVSASKTTSNVMEDPFKIFESASPPANSASGVFSDPLEEISELSSSGSTKLDSSSVPKSHAYEDEDPFEGLGRSVPAFSSKKNNQKDSSPDISDTRRDWTRASKEEPSDRSSFRSLKKRSQKRNSVGHDTESCQPSVDSPIDSSDFDNLGSRAMPPPSHNSLRSQEANVWVGMSPKYERNSESADVVWLTVSEIPLFTQPTSAPPPSRPPPPRPAQFPKSRTGSPAPANVRKKVNDSSSFPSSTQYSQFSKPAPDASWHSTASQMDELEDFTIGRNRNNEHLNGLYGEELEMNSVAAAMKEAMDRAEAKFRHAKEVKERESTKAARSKEAEHLEKDGNTLPDERENRDWMQREREKEEREQRRLKKEREMEEKEREQWRLERERERAKEIEREREKARQAVERATREARERAAAEARLKAEKAAVEKAQAEARERAERAAVQRAQAEARERAAAEARARAEKAAVKARERERESIEAKEKETRERAAAARAEAEARVRSERTAAEARERAAAEAQERAAASARVNQQKNDNDLESFFSANRASSAPRPPRANSSESVFDTQFQNRQEPNVTKKTDGAPTGIRKASSSTNIVDDLSSIFGAPPASGEFQEVEGESEERRRARLERHQRAQERAAKALAEKNERDLQTQREQAERHRIAETLDVEIKRWAAGKEGNLRALLSTLQYVLWPECGWQPVSLTDLITGAAVKKVYRKATLCIHPDKVQQKGANLHQKYIAEKVFDLLKEAWNKFNSEELF